MANCVCGIPREFGGSQVGVTSGPLAIWLRQHMQSIRQHFIEKSKVAQQAYEGHKVGRNSQNLQTESKSSCRKFKELAHMASSYQQGVWQPIENYYMT
jgi:hypothetical protein